jgi:lia operon protein LiaF
MHSKFGPIVLILVGAVFLLANLGIFNAQKLGAMLSTYWPVILIVVGLIGLLTGRKRS